MNEEIIKQLANYLNVKESQIKSVLNLLEDGCTIPFIARYRKEATGSLDEEQIRVIENQYTYLMNLLKRKEDVIRLIDEKGLLTEELQRNIMACNKLTEVEDLYRPFKEKKKTKASEAIKLGLEPLAKMIMAFPTNGTLENLAIKYIKEGIENTEKALEGASFIIAEWISDNAFYRKSIRQNIFNNGFITSKLKKNAEDSKKTYEMYYDFQEKIKYAKHYRVLAMNRGEDEKILNVSLDYDFDNIQEYLENKIIKNKESFVVELVKSAIKDSLKRLILPSIEREIRSELTEHAEQLAIENFKSNLENLLLTKPIKNSKVLGFDPAFRTGCKLAVLDESGNMIKVETIYPHEPHNKKEEAKKILRDLIQKYDINLIAIGNGTASRESEMFVADAIKDLDVKYAIVSEAGASVYSASDLAIKEFPDLTVEKRSAISIGRRVQDPLSELVKIDPKSIGVGEYQHDVNQKNLSEALEFTVEKIVNEVGVNVNTASTSILKYISGMNKKAIDAITNYKELYKIKSREEIKKIKGISDKIYEQAIGFLRIPDGNNLLDKTGIHPESYDITNKLINKVNLDLKDINKEEFKTKLNEINIKEMAKNLNTDEFTLSDIIKELLNPGLDPRDNLDNIILKKDVLDIKDLKKGMQLNGVVRNVVSFGAFVDIGLHDDGLIHVSKLSHDFVKDPLDIVKVGDIVDCYVVDVDLEKNRVFLSLIK